MRTATKTKQVIDSLYISLDIGIDPADDAGVHISHLRQAVDLRITGTAFAEDDLSHPPIALAHLITANVHEVTWTDMEDGNISLNRAAGDRRTSLIILVRTYSWLKRVRMASSKIRTLITAAKE